MRLTSNNVGGAQRKTWHVVKDSIGSDFLCALVFLTALELLCNMATIDKKPDPLPSSSYQLIKPKPVFA